MATIPVYLTDDDGNVILGLDDEAIIVGYVNSSLITGSNGGNVTSELPGGGTTFRDVVANASPEGKAEVLRGLRLAKSIRGRLNRFEIGEGPSDFYVKYNHSIFGGRFQSAYTALGSIAGTYLRRGGSAFTKELVEAALVTGAFANFSVPSSPQLPGDFDFTGVVGGGTATAFSWTFTPDSGTPLTASVQNPTVTLGEATWTISFSATIDGEQVDAISRTLSVGNLAYAGDMTNNNPTPSLGDTITLGLPLQNEELLGDITWNFNVELAAGQRVDLTEGVDFTSSASGNTISVTFLTAGNIEVSATAQDTNGTSLTTRANLDVADIDTTNTVTNHSILSQATADALVQGDTHLIILGDSLMNPIAQDRFRRGLVDSWKPARWAGIQPAAQTGSATSGNNNEHDLHYWGSSAFIINSGSGINSANVRRDGTNGSTTIMDTRLAHRVTMESSFTQLESEGAGSFRIRTLGRGMDSDILRGRLQSTDDHFYRQSSLNTRALFYNLDGTPTLRATADDVVGSPEIIPMSPNSYTLIDLPRDASAETSGNYRALNVTFDSIDSGDTFGVMDSFIYSPLVSGLSVSYCGHGGWCTTQHSGDPVRVAARPANQPNQYFDDEACVEHLRMVAFKDKAQTQLRDNIFILLEIQNNSRTHDSQMREDLLPILTRWNNAADVVDPSGNLRAQLKMIVMSLVDIVPANQHDEVAAMMPDIVGLGGYEQVEFIDLYNAVKQADGGIYANPADYTSVASGGNGSISPTWYESGDAVHPVLEGSRKIMEIFWSVVKDAAADPAGFSFSINAPANGTTDDTYNYTLSGSLPADRLVTWSVDGSIVAYGDSYTLPSSVGTFVVSAQVDGADGAAATATASAVTISAANSAPVISSVSVAGSTPEAGDVFSLVVEASDPDGDALSYTVVNPEGDVTATGGPTTAASVTLGPIVATSAGIPAVYNVTVTDGSLSDSADITIVPVAPNGAPVIGSYGVTVAGPYTVGDDLAINGLVITDPDNDSMTYTMTHSIDGVDQGAIDVLTPFNGVVTANTATGSHVVDTAGEYVFTLTVTDANGATATATTAITVSAPVAATMVYSASAEYNGANAWINETELTGGSYWENRTGDPSLDPFNNFVVPTGQIRWFTQQDGGGLIATAVANDSANGTHEVRLVSPSGETFILSKTWSFVANNRVDWANTGTALGSVQGSRTGTQLISEMRSSVGAVWELQYWEL